MTLEAIVHHLKPVLARIEALEKVAEELRAAKSTTLADCYRGVWEPGPYKRGDAVTWEGSLFICWCDTTAKPGMSGDFRLAVKRGRDGKDLR